MKKLLFFVAALFVTSFAQAQDGIKLGLKAGANLTNFSGDDTEDAKNLFGLHAGAFLDFGISEMVSIRPELLYSMKGAKAEFKEDGEEFKFTRRLHYIDVPVLAHIKAGGLFFEFGPTLGYQVSTSNKFEINGKNIDIDDNDEEEGNKKFELGYAAGLGYQFGNGLGLGLRYQGGITSIYEDNDAKVRNSVFQLSLMYTIGGR